MPRMGRCSGNIDLGGVPEQTVADGKGTVYQVLQDRPGGVAVIDAKTMKVTATYPFGDNGGCNGLALDVKNQILFAACSAVGPAPARGTPGQPAPAGPPPAPDPNAKPPQTFVILSAKDGKILERLPLAGSSDGAAFNPATMEAFSTQGNGTMTIVKEKSPTSFEVEQNLKTWPSNGARTIAFDSKTGHLFAMASETAPPPPPTAGDHATGRRPWRPRRARFRVPSRSSWSDSSRRADPSDGGETSYRSRKTWSMSFSSESIEVRRPGGTPRPTGRCRGERGPLFRRDPGGRARSCRPPRHLCGPRRRLERRGSAPPSVVALERRRGGERDQRVHERELVMQLANVGEGFAHQRNRRVGVTAPHREDGANR